MRGVWRLSAWRTQLPSSCRTWSGLARAVARVGAGRSTVLQVRATVQPLPKHVVDAAWHLLPAQQYCLRCSVGARQRPGCRSAFPSRITTYQESVDDLYIMDLYISCCAWCLPNTELLDTILVGYTTLSLYFSILYSNPWVENPRLCAPYLSCLFACPAGQPDWGGHCIDNDIPHARPVPPERAALAQHATRQARPASSSLLRLKEFPAEMVPERVVPRPRCWWGPAPANY